MFAKFEKLNVQLLCVQACAIHLAIGIKALCDFCM